MIIISTHSDCYNYHVFNSPSQHKHSLDWAQPAYHRASFNLYPNVCVAHLSISALDCDVFGNQIWRCEDDSNCSQIWRHDDDGNYNLAIVVWQPMIIVIAIWKSKLIITKDHSNNNLEIKDHSN